MSRLIIDFPTAQAAGLFKLEAVRLDALGKELSRRTLADWFPNLITDQGLDRMGANTGWGQYCQVGSGDNAPNVADTSLETFVAASNTQQAVSVSAQGAPPYYASAFKTYRFAAGVATGNLSEVGIGWSAGAGTLFSRALILDGGGSPTTITVLADEVLDVTYEFRVYPPTVDVVGSIVISSVNYDYIIRASNVTTPFSAGTPTNGTWGTSLDSFNGSGTSAVVSTVARCKSWSGDIGAVTTIPSGTQSQGTSATSLAYGASDLYRDGSFLWDLNAGNVGGTRSITYGFSWCAYQIQFTPVIPKDATKRLTLVFRHSWARKILP